MSTIRIPDVRRNYERVSADLGQKKVADERKRLEGIARREQLTPGWLAPALKEADVVIEEEAR